MPTPSPCDRVRTTCEAYISQHSEHVTIDRQAIPALARQIQQQARIEWDEEEWHYDAPAGEQRQERVALYILALDAINFCFWPSEQLYEYKDLAISLRNAAKRDHDEQQRRPFTLCPSFSFSASNLATMTVEEMRKLFSDHHEHEWVPPDLSVRCQLWNELGQGLLEHFGGSAWTLIQRAQGSAVSLVQLLLDHFAGFRDYYSATTSSSTDESVFFLKRAQICVGDWNAALHLNLKDMDQLTTFADYRVPQLLRHCGVLRYSKDLSQTVDNKIELEVNSAQELSIRAATVTAVEWIVAHLKQLDSDTKWTAVETDWYLWQVGERMQLKGELALHHRVRTIYY